MRPEEAAARERVRALMAFGPCPCGCGAPRRQTRLTASDQCAQPESKEISNDH